jgi:hypothetical protein
MSELPKPVQPAPADVEEAVVKHLREASVVHIGALTVHADEVIVGKKEDKPTAKIIERYRWNAGRLALVAILLVVWFNTHLQAWATQKVVFGTATVWALVQLIRSWSKDFASDVEGARKRLLAREGTREHLLFALIAAAALLSVTSSLYVRLGDREQSHVRIDIVDSKGGLYMDSLVLEPSSRISGQLFLPRFRTEKLQVIVREPANYVFLQNPIALKPWSAVELTFGDPQQFAKRRLHALRVVPGWTLNGIDDPDKQYEAIVKVGDASFTINDFKFKTLYLGVSDKDSLARIAREQTGDAFTEQLKKHLDDHPGAADRDEYITGWKTEPRLETTRNFEAGEAVVVTVRKKGSAKGVTTTPQKIDDGEITTIFIERRKS